MDEEERKGAWKQGSEMDLGRISETDEVMRDSGEMEHGKTVETRAKANVSAGDPAYTFGEATCSDALSADFSLQYSVNFAD